VILSINPCPIRRPAAFCLVKTARKIQHWRDSSSAKINWQPLQYTLCQASISALLLANASAVIFTTIATSVTLISEANELICPASGAFDQTMLFYRWQVGASQIVSRFKLELVKADRNATTVLLQTIADSGILAMESTLKPLPCLINCLGY